MSNIIKFPTKNNYTVDDGKEAKAGFWVYRAYIDDELVGFITIHPVHNISTFDKIGRNYKCNNRDIENLKKLVLTKLKEKK